MQEAVGGRRIREGIFRFPETMPAPTAPVHYYLYRVSRTDWLARQDSGAVDDPALPKS